MKFSRFTLFLVIVFVIFFGAYIVDASAQNKVEQRLKAYDILENTNHVELLINGKAHEVDVDSIIAGNRSFKSISDDELVLIAKVNLNEVDTLLKNVSVFNVDCDLYNTYFSSERTTNCYTVYFEVKYSSGEENIYSEISEELQQVLNDIVLDDN